ncbi:hypothetical protein G5714_024704 [Onychostoma macrolepis]|uniref:Uncharacterized protein n=1 Tax=Onychostoma macrolepis TaxID=369639 RepID=A0A7J6BLK5_9TELE|nr:hypothetical protein G5714_024704 [Onychostoma macrolepis]
MPRDTSRWRAGQYLGAPHSRVWFSLTMKAKLRGFSATPGPEHVSLAGWALPQRPLSAVLVRSQLSSRGFSAAPGPETCLAGGAQRHVSLAGWALPQRPLVRFSVAVTAKLQGLFGGQAQKHVSLVGWALPQRPLLCLSVAVKAKLQRLFGDARPRNTSRWWGGHYPSAPWSVLVRSQLSSRGFSAAPGPETRLAGGVGTTPAPLTLFVGNSES